MNKKASSILLLLFEILAVLGVAAMMVYSATFYAKSDSVLKINTAEELRLMVNTLAAVPGDALVKYPLNVSAFSFLLSSGSVAVFKEGEPEQIWVKREFFLPSGFAAAGVLKEKEKLCLEKKNKLIQLRECRPNEP